MQEEHEEEQTDEQIKELPDQAALRAQLVQRLRAVGTLQDEAVARALATVPRHLFLPGVPLAQAYADTAIPTHWKDHVAISSASQPAIVAIMLQQLNVAPGMRVLEIGAGTGYNAALLAELVGPSGSVTTLDIDDTIVAESTGHLAAAGYPQVRAIATDGAAGWPAGAPYDRIILTVGASDITPAWFEQLREDGLLVLPLWLGGVELSVAFRKRESALVSESQTPCGFMRLRGEEAGAEQWVALPKGRQLFAEQAAGLAAPVSHLLATRPRLRFWLRPQPSFFQHLNLRGHRLVAIYSVRKPKPGHRMPGRWGIYAEGADGPSLALFASAAPVLLSFGGAAAERIIEEEFVRWQQAGTPPIERWRIIARPTTTAAAPPADDLYVARRHFTFIIETP